MNDVLENRAERQGEMFGGFFFCLHVAFDCISVSIFTSVVLLSG